MILIGRYRSPFSRRVAISLRLYELSYEHRSITAWANLADIQAFSPVGRVLALVLDDRGARSAVQAGSMTKRSWPCSTTASFSAPISTIRPARSASMVV